MLRNQLKAQALTLLKLDTSTGYGFPLAPLIAAIHSLRQRFGKAYTMQEKSNNQMKSESRVVFDNDSNWATGSFRVPNGRSVAFVYNYCN